MVTSKLALTCFKLAASLHSCHVKFVASLLQTKIAIWVARTVDKTPKRDSSKTFALRNRSQSINTHYSVIQAQSFYTRPRQAVTSHGIIWINLDISP
ncbi:hypothetical protein AVEN_264776-1 [Araneus ventricosus]|uniref:Uncharacterized protein n=1 Tax=Araneus ventricosus TaxID=182803 RepID=A0A4Y2HRG4_ARAVE|nr:hypothetical protein AVEN_264776-1 [Araneus ventricosus]